MSMVTILLVVVTVGMIFQHNEWGSRLLGGGTGFELVRDEVIAPVNKLVDVDVLANDVDIKPGDAEGLLVVTQPPCGQAAAHDGKIQFIATSLCSGPQRFSYAVSGRGEGATGEVLVVVQSDEPAQSTVAADAQRDVPAPVPAQPAGTTAVPRELSDPSTLAAQPDSTNQLVSVPSVPRPQAGEAGALDGASAAALAAGTAGLKVGVDSGAGPSITVPSAQANGGAGLASLPPTVPQVVPDPGAASAFQQPGAQPDAQPTALGGGQTPVPQPAPGAPPAAGEAPINRDAPAQVAINQAPALPVDEPVLALGALLGQDVGSGLAPVDTTSPPVLSDPMVLARVDPAAEPAQAQFQAGPQAQPEAAAAAPAAARPPCETPPTLTLDIRPGALTVVSAMSPCDTFGTGRITYDGLDIAFALDAVGMGSVTVPGFQPSSIARLELDSGNGLDFELAFDETETIDRVAVIWEMPVTLAVHAFEFGAAAGGAGHVSPAQPRDFEAVRRRGGGYLMEWEMLQGRGQNIAVYTYLWRPGGPTGVVDLRLDFTSRSEQGAPETCGAGAQAAPDFTVVRMAGGRLQRPERRRIAALDCAGVAQAERLIDDAVDDILVVRR
jgi:hypothetical protein